MEVPKADSVLAEGDYIFQEQLEEVIPGCLLLSVLFGLQIKTQSLGSVITLLYLFAN